MSRNHLLGTTVLQLEIRVYYVHFIKEVKSVLSNKIKTTSCMSLHEAILILLGNIFDLV